MTYKQQIERERMIYRIQHIFTQLEEPFRDELRCLMTNVWTGLTSLKSADQRLRRFGMMLSRRAAR